VSEAADLLTGAGVDVVNPHDMPPSNGLSSATLAVTDAAMAAAL